MLPIALTGAPNLRQDACEEIPMRVRTLVAALLACATLSAPAYASAPGSIEVTCDVDRKAFRSLANAAPDVTFRLWDAETGGSQCGPDHVVPMQDLRVFKAKTDRFDGQRPRTFGEIRAVLGSDAQPIELCAGAESWLDVTVGTTTLTCEFSADPNSKPGVLPDAPARRRLQAVAFAREAEHSETCEMCTSTSDVSVRVYRSSNQTIPRGIGVVVDFDEARWDTNNLHTSGDPTKLVAQTPGKYLIFGHVRWAVPSDPSASVREVGIRLNGSTFVASDRRSDAIGDQVNQSVSTHYELGAGDYVELEVHHTALPTSLDIVADSGLSPEFGMVKLP
jgi:hypothetical protein